jgi:hypothetical protein
MPLIKSKSKKAFSHNVEAEMRAGKPQKQAVAIAYSEKRAAKKATGGSLNPQHYESDTDYYEARQKAGLPARPRGYTSADRDAIINAKPHKAEPYKAPVVTRRDPEKERSAMEGIEKSLASIRATREAAKKLTGKKSGGKVKKMCGGGW